MKKILSLFLMMMIFVSCTNVLTNKTTKNFSFQTRQIEKQVDELYNKMSVEERTAQMFDFVQEH